MALKRPVYHLTVVKSFPCISLSAISDATDVRIYVHPPPEVLSRFSFQVTTSSPSQFPRLYSSRYRYRYGVHLTCARAPTAPVRDQGARLRRFRGQRNIEVE